MLTSHEFMVANKKRRKNDHPNRKKKSNAGQSGNTAEYSDHYSENYSEGNPQYQNKPKKNRPNQQRARHNHGNDNHFQKKQNDDHLEGYVPEVEEGKVYQGIVQNYYREKGYGFIRAEEFKVPAFFHYSEIQLDGFKYLIKQQKVEFKARVSDEGKLQAYEVTPTELAPTQKRQIFNKDKSSNTE
ncbi:cold shock domain-containing protein [Pleionea litopenaei]|uniref:Cold shock domain-containing protein n=1 Tax=Pleionea litopenaei TaxID=3070815 RepID=A0AA51RUI8_9GAMM|nr:cold shock domain-containing protein [Pleionea sp. HL-JVS1]WMS87918.1 cold shock domain-containing protein [Pleionea sp. HL-JVS1]